MHYVVLSDQDQFVELTRHKVIQNFTFKNSVIVSVIHNEISVKSLCTASGEYEKIWIYRQSLHKPASASEEAINSKSSEDKLGRNRK